VVAQYLVFAHAHAFFKIAEVCRHMVGFTLPLENELVAEWKRYEANHAKGAIFYSVLYTWQPENPLGVLKLGLITGSLLG
jgi:hypothetical protein